MFTLECVHMFAFRAGLFKHSARVGSGPLYRWSVCVPADAGVPRASWRLPGGGRPSIRGGEWVNDSLRFHSRSISAAPKCLQSAMILTVCRGPPTLNNVRLSTRSTSAAACVRHCYSRSDILLLICMIFFYTDNNMKKNCLKADHPLFDWLINCVILNHF